MVLLTSAVEERHSVHYQRILDCIWEQNRAMLDETVLIEARGHLRVHYICVVSLSEAMQHLKGRHALQVNTDLLEKLPNTLFQQIVVQCPHLQVPQMVPFPVSNPVTTVRSRDQVQTGAL
jgi:hypothetical protein